MKYLFFLCFFFLSVSCSDSGSPTPSTSEPTTREVATGLDTPWEILWGPDDRIWVTERKGIVSTIDPASGEKTVLLTINEVAQQGESGLMGMALHPDFEQQPVVFLAYTYSAGSGLMVKIVRYDYSGSGLGNPVTLLDGIRGNVIHDGCRLVFAPDKTLFITTGDAADQSLPQQPSSLNGKILRIHPDGSIPDDNPQADNPMWALGLRNSQGMVFGPDGTLYTSEHGPNTDDEVNRIRKGANYGWPRVQGYCDLPAEKEFCEQNDVVEPLAAWTPTLAVCGLDYYNSDAIPQWKNSLLMTCLKADKLVQLSLSNDGTTVTGQQDFFVRRYGRLRDLCISPDGRVFIATSNRDGRGNPAQRDDRIIEISPNSSGNGE